MPDLPGRQCSFCKKSRNKVATLVAGPDDLSVCDGCIALMCDVVAEQDDAWRKRRIRSLTRRDSAFWRGS